MARPLKPCGTEAAYHRHLKSGEQPCGLCRDAHTDYARRWKRGQIPPRPPTDHGTHSGYVSHRRRNETACDPCKKAHADYNRQYRRDGAA